MVHLEFVFDYDVLVHGNTHGTHIHSVSLVFIRHSISQLFPLQEKSLETELEVR